MVIECRKIKFFQSELNRQVGLAPNICTDNTEDIKKWMRETLRMCYRSKNLFPGLYDESMQACRRLKVAIKAPSISDTEIIEKAANLMQEVSDRIDGVPCP